MKYCLIVFFFFYLFDGKSQSNSLSKLTLISKEWNLEYHTSNKSNKIIPKYKKMYRFDLDGTFYEKDGNNIGKGHWQFNTDSTKICWTYKLYNQQTYKNIYCEDFPYTIADLSNDSLKLSIQGRDGVSYYIFSNFKK